MKDEGTTDEVTKGEMTTDGPKDDGMTIGGETGQETDEGMTETGADTEIGQRIGTTTTVTVTMTEIDTDTETEPGLKSGPEIGIGEGTINNEMYRGNGTEMGHANHEL